MDFKELSQIVIQWVKLFSVSYSVSQIDSFFGLIYGQAIDSHIESIGPIYLFQRW